RSARQRAQVDQVLESLPVDGDGYPPAARPREIGADLEGANLFRNQVGRRSDLDRGAPGPYDASAVQIEQRGRTEALPIRRAQRKPRPRFPHQRELRAELVEAALRETLLEDRRRREVGGEAFGLETVVSAAKIRGDAVVEIVL